MRSAACESHGREGRSRKSEVGGWRRGAIGFASLTSVFCLLASERHLFAQDDTAPPPKPPGVRIAFLPPPMEGTLSLGIYDKAGKLVRTLASEAAEQDFTIGLNGLITHWDGRDDSGKVLPAGAYSARGYSVGAINVEGVAFHGNDWMIDDESPRLRRILSIELRPSGRLALWAEGPDGKPQLVRCDQAGEFAGEIPPDPQVTALAVGGAPAAEAPPPSARAVVTDGRVAIVEESDTRALELPELIKPIDASLGRDGVWVIDATAAGVEVKEFRRDGEFRRRLAINPAEPAPRRIFASHTSDLIFLIEEKPGLQRVRGLALEAAADAASPTSTWKTVLSKSIVASDAFAEVADKLGRPQPFVPREKFTVQLQPNPLLQDATMNADVTIGFDTTGSFLKTLDGLPLRRITAAPHSNGPSSARKAAAASSRSCKATALSWRSSRPPARQHDGFRRRRLRVGGK